MDRDVIAREVESGEASRTSYDREKEPSVRELGVRLEEVSNERIEKVYRLDPSELLRHASF